MRIRAKNLSLIMKIIAIAVFVLLYLFVTIATGKLPEEDQSYSILYLCLFVVLSFSPIDLSMIAKNIFNTKTEAQKNVDKKRTGVAEKMTNTVKLLAVFLTVLFNFGYLLSFKNVMSAQDQLTILRFSMFMVIIFSPVDLSLIFQNIFLPERLRRL